MYMLKKNKIFILFILYCTCICIQKENYNANLITSLLSIVSSNKILKSDLGCKELGHTITFLDYLNHLQNDGLVMIRQLDLQFFLHIYHKCK
jgi:hypothetical protein